MNMKDSMGRFRTQSLFFELRRKGSNAIFTLKPQDHEVDGVVYKSLRLLFLDMADLTEYDFAIQVFNSWDHWVKICNNSIILPHIEKWRTELELKVRSDAIRTIQEVSSYSQNKGALQAAKWLAEKGWDKKRGRPSKLEVAKEKKIAAGIHEELDEDYARIIDKTAH